MADLTTLAKVKEWLPISSDTSDGVLARLITAASGFIEDWLDRTVLSVEYDETCNGLGGSRLLLPNRPVTAVSLVSVDGTCLQWAADARSTGYLFDATGIYLTRGASFTRGIQNVRTVYTAGYATVPPAIEQACIHLVALRFKEGDRVGQASKVVAGQNVSFLDRDMPPDVATALRQYRKVAPL